MNLRNFATVICVWLCCLSCNAATQNMDKTFAQWASKPSEELMDKGRAFLYESKFRDAMVVYSTVANRYYKEGVSEEELEISVRAMNNLGYVYFYYYFDYPKSYQYLQQAKRIAEAHRFLSNLAYINLNLGNLYVTLTETQPQDKYFVNKSLEYYKAAFEYAVASKNWDVLQVIYGNLLLTGYVRKKMPLITQQIKHYHRLKFPKGTVLVKYNMLMEKTIQCQQSRRYMEALKYAEQAVDAVDTRDTPERYKYSAIGLKMEMYQYLNNNEGFSRSLGELRQLIAKYGMKDLKVAYYQQLYLYYKDKANKDSVNHYEMEYLKAKDALVTESRIQAVGEMHFLTALQDTNDRVRLLAAKHRQQQIVILLCCILVIGAVTSALYFVRKNRDLRRKQQALYEKMQESLHRESENRQAKYLNSNLDAQEKAQIFEKIQEVMADISVVCSPDFSLRLLAEHVETPYAKVSQVVNEMAGKNFNAFLGECRVKEACRRLSDTAQYGHFTIEAISASVGFKSRTNFVAMFKKVTGLTPSEYQRSARLQNVTKSKA